MKKVLLAAMLAAVTATGAMAHHPIYRECEGPAGQLTIKGNWFAVGADLHNGKPFSEAIRYIRIKETPHIFKRGELSLEMNSDAQSITMSSPDGTTTYVCGVW